MILLPECLLPECPLPADWQQLFHLGNPLLCTHHSTCTWLGLTLLCHSFFYLYLQCLKCLQNHCTCRTPEGEAEVQSGGKRITMTSTCFSEVLRAHFLITVPVMVPVTAPPTINTSVLLYPCSNHKVGHHPNDPQKRALLFLCLL